MPASTTSVAVAAMTFLLGLAVAVLYTRVQAASSRRSADAASSGARLARLPRLQVTVDDERQQLVLILDGPEAYSAVELVEWRSANPDYERVPIQLVLDRSDPSGAAQLGSLAPHQKKLLRYQRVEPGAGGSIHLTLRCRTATGDLFPAYVSADIPGTPIPISLSRSDLVHALAKSNESADEADAAAADDWLEKLKRLSWAVQSLCACCYTTALTKRHVDSEGEPDPISLDFNALVSTSSYRTLEQAVIDLACDLLPGKRRIAIYYGDAAVLEPFQRPGWFNADPPALLAGPAPDATGVSSPDLLSALQRGKGLYVSNCSGPLARDELVAEQLPGRNEYKTLSVTPIRAFRSFTEADSRHSPLLGAILLQHEEDNAVRDPRDREMFAILGSLLGTALVHLTCGSTAPALNGRGS